jgi:hypothetical protein
MLQAHGLSVPENALALVEAHIAAGGYVGFSTAYRVSVISPKVFNRFVEVRGYCVKPESSGYRLAVGKKSSVYLFPGQLKFVRAEQ